VLAASWQRPQPDLLARALVPLSWLYRGAAAAHRALYTSGLRKRERAMRPLIVVGNLVAGGAGKTPTVIALVEQMRQRGYTPGVVSRGYGRHSNDSRAVKRTSTPAEVGDEPLLIHLRTGAPVVVAARRIDAARELCLAYPDVDLLIADDGLQHHALRRDAQVIVFDDRGVGNGLLLPAGPLRQPMPPRAPERSVVVYNAERASTPWPGYFGTRRLSGPVGLVAWWKGKRADERGWSELQGRRVIACAGVAVPQRFFSMLQQQGLKIEPIVLPDHASFDALPWPQNAADVVVTEKDAVKIRPERVGDTRVWVAPLDFVLDAQVGATLAQWLAAPP
jgi:tetraacyldisaccharide 4'-kinase